jgi:hypothetical protein
MIRKQKGNCCGRSLEKSRSKMNVIHCALLGPASADRALTRRRLGRQCRFPARGCYQTIATDRPHLLRKGGAVSWRHREEKGEKPPPPSGSRDICCLDSNWIMAGTLKTLRPARSCAFPRQRRPVPSAQWALGWPGVRMSGCAACISARLVKRGRWAAVWWWETVFCFGRDWRRLSPSGDIC